MRAPGLILLAAICALAPSPSPARAERHVVSVGETIERVAQRYGCSVEAVLEANRLKTTIVRPGTSVRIPACPRPGASSIRARAAVRAPRDAASGDGAGDDARARQALAVIDGTAVVRAARPAHALRAEPPEDAPGTGDPAGDGAGGSESIGQPWNGRLRGGARLREGDGEGFRVRRPHRAFGARHVVEHLRGAIAAVRALYPGVHTLAIGDLSAPHGGKIGDHHSHQSGLDVDVGFYFRAPPEGYPDSFVAANDALDLAATWALITAFARTADLDDGVQVIFLDRDVQARLHRWARARGTPDAQLAELLQYPRASDARVGLVRHWPNHADHLHVRWKRGP